MTCMVSAARRVRKGGVVHQAFNPASHRCTQAEQGKGKGRLYAAPASNNPVECAMKRDLGMDEREFSR
jgi:hypothetical protein